MFSNWRWVCRRLVGKALHHKDDHARDGMRIIEQSGVDSVHMGMALSLHSPHISFRMVAHFKTKGW